MNWFKRKIQGSGFRVQGTGRITGTARSSRLTSYLLPLTSALFTAFLMIHTAAVLSSPQDFITGGGGSEFIKYC